MNSSPYNTSGSTIRGEVFDQHVNVFSHGHNLNHSNINHTGSIHHPTVITKIDPDISFDRDRGLHNTSTSSTSNHSTPTTRTSTTSTANIINSHHIYQGHGHSAPTVPTTAAAAVQSNTNVHDQNKDHVNAAKGTSTVKNSGSSSGASTSTGNRKSRRDGHNLRKAPGAPKRFKSSYIMFFMAKQKEIKAELGEGASVGEISKKSSEKWRNLPKEERAIWDAKAEEDKERYNREKEKYTGPWQVPWKRAKKNPKAPKRPMSAFLFFSQEKRRSIKDAHPDMRNTEISRVLGGMWKKASPEERAPHIEREAAEREKYKIEIAKWRKEEEARSRMAAARAEAKWEAKKALEECQSQGQNQDEQHDCNNASNLNFSRKSPPLRQGDSPLPLSHQPRPSSPTIPVQSYYPQSSYGDFYPVQSYNAMPQYNTYNPYPAAPPPPPQSQQQHHVQNQAYYRCNYPPAPPHPDYRPTSRHPQEYNPAPPIGRSDSIDSSGHRHNQHMRSHNTLSPAPVGIPPQYESFTHFPPSALHHVQGYSNVDQRPSSGSNPNQNYPDDYPPAPPL